MMEHAYHHDRVHLLGMELGGALQIITKFLLLMFVIFVLILVALDNGFADSRSVFKDYGIAVPVSAIRGAVAVSNPGQCDCVLAWLEDCRGCYSLLSINATTGSSKQFDLPFDSNKEAPFASVLSRNNKFYTHFNGYFIEFDPLLSKFSFIQKTSHKTAMSMTEDDSGNIWVATYPDCGLLMYNPQTRRLNDFGVVNTEKWFQYPYYLAPDDTGWIYIGLGYTKSQIVAFDPRTKLSRKMLTPRDRQLGVAYVYRDVNGKVYARSCEDNAVARYGMSPRAGSSGWYELYSGKVVEIERLGNCRPADIKAGRRDIFVRKFNDGFAVKKIDMQFHKLTLMDASRRTCRVIDFVYKTKGASILNLIVDSCGVVVGGTYFPHYGFAFSNVKNKFSIFASDFQWNALAKCGRHMYVGLYPKGLLFDYLLTCACSYNEPNCISDAGPIINRPYDIAVSADGNTVVMCGAPGYGMTGGGLVFVDMLSKCLATLEHQLIVPGQTVRSLAFLADGNLVGGTAVPVGSVMRNNAQSAALFVADVKSREILWRDVLIPGVQEYSDLIVRPDGLVYGIADRYMFFIFDPNKRTLIKVDISKVYGRVNWQQQYRAFVVGDNGLFYILFRDGIVVVDGDGNHKLLVRSPVPITAGGDYWDGKIFFASGSHVYSYNVLQ